MPILANPQAERKAIKMLALGTPQNEVAATVGVSQPTISRFANNEENRAAIQAEAQRLIDVLPDTVGLSVNVVKAAKLESDKLVSLVKGQEINSDLIELGLKEAQEIKKAVGIAASHAPSTVFNLFYQDNRQTLVSPIVQELIASHFGAAMVEIESDSEPEV